MSATTEASSRSVEEGPCIPADWTGADFDSVEVLVLLHIPDPIDRVTRARAPRGAGRASERSAR